MVSRPLRNLFFAFSAIWILDGVLILLAAGTHWEPGGRLRLGGPGFGFGQSSSDVGTASGGVPAK